MLSFRKPTAVTLIAVVGLALSSACSEDEDNPAAGTGGTNSGTSGSNNTGANPGDAGDGNSSGGTDPGTGGTINNPVGGAGPDPLPAGGSPAIEQLCDAGVVCQCNDGVDNDDDGETDGFDAECQGPLDHDEGSFATGIPMDNVDRDWVDCFFDGDSGSGNDDCEYPDGCLLGDIPVDDPRCAGAASDACVEFCGARAQNGCDCFGCCTIQLENGESLDILTWSYCSLEEVENEELCMRCDKTDSCENPCGECELCPGRTADDLPDSCTPDATAGGAPGEDPPAYTCEGADVCSDTIPCPGGYCLLGCCIPTMGNF